MATGIIALIVLTWLNILHAVIDTTMDAILFHRDGPLEGRASFYWHLLKYCRDPILVLCGVAIVVGSYYIQDYQLYFMSWQWWMVVVLATEVLLHWFVHEILQGYYRRNRLKF